MIAEDVAGKFLFNSGDGRHPRLRARSAPSICSSSTTGALEPLDAAARHDLLEILEDRYGRHSTIVPTYADAVLDRLVRKA